MRQDTLDELGPPRGSGSHGLAGGVRTRRVGRWGHSLAVTLSADACRLLGLRKGAELCEVLTADGALELQPVAVRSAAARKRRAAAVRGRDLFDQNRRLRARAARRYEAGFNAGYAAGFAKAGLNILLDLAVTTDELRGLLTELRARLPGLAPQVHDGGKHAGPGG